MYEQIILSIFPSIVTGLLTSACTISSLKKDIQYMRENIISLNNDVNKLSETAIKHESRLTRLEVLTNNEDC